MFLESEGWRIYMVQTAAVCEKLLPTGQQCGITAIGRCTTCWEAFCKTHQARQSDSAGSVAYVDLCANCFAQSPQEVARRKAEEEYAKAAAIKHYISLGAARADLLKNAVQPEQLYHITSEWQGPKKGFLGTNLGMGQYVNVRTPMVRGWILGQFKWRWHPPEELSIERVCVTALLDVDPNNHGDFMYFGTSGGLVRVEGSPDAYLFNGGGEFVGSWEEVVQTVKRLAGVAS